VTIYTKFGDAGQTQLVTGDTLAKSAARIEAYGNIDELGAFLGLLREQALAKENMGAERFQLLVEVQHCLFNIGSELATPPSKLHVLKGILLEESSATKLEQDIDAMTAELPVLRSFILSGGSALSAAAHICRTVCRRAERNIVSLHQAEPVRKELLIFINRLSDWFFVLARYCLQKEGKTEIHWQKS
jgi:cob(I)alamin adenosyltransferase